ncbi:hypothetical protein C8R45DRAFT_1162721 [Mycena sanguinolenta]|nr:hypothetical protein C8R45DRAFT_1162721 [Mycena sanguinolenta]
MLSSCGRLFWDITVQIFHIYAMSPRPVPDTTCSAMSILVDNSNPLVQYSAPGGWFASGKAPEFGATTHASATPGDTATLVFEGISIGVYGTIVPNFGHSSLNFSIDGVDIGFYQAPVVPTATQNQLFWKSSIFSEARHTLVVTVNHTSMHGTSRIPTFFLDYFIYNTTSTAGQTLLIDDTDASVDYSPDGTGISLFGPPGQKGFSASIVVDRTQPVLSQSQTGLGENQFFNTSGLSPGPHIINVTVLEGNLSIDYFIVTNSPATGQSGTSQSKKPIAADEPGTEPP